MAKFVSYQHYNIHIDIQGEGAPVVLLHGWPTNSQLWKAQVEQLKEGFRTVDILLLWISRMSLILFCRI